MWTQIILLVLTFLLYKFIYKPWKLFNWYVKSFQAQGYRVYNWKYNPVGLQSFTTYQEHRKRYNDALHIAKIDYQGYDIAISNLFSKIMIQILNPDLIKQFYSADKLKLHKRSKIDTSLIMIATGPGIGLVDGQLWFKKRQILNKVFNFEFVKGLIPTIIQTIDENFNEIEKSKYYPKVYLFDLLSKIFGQITTKSFFGNAFRYSIQGIQVSEYFGSLLKQTLYCFTSIPEIMIFGSWVIKLGYRSIFRQINHKSKVYKAKAKEFVELELKKRYQFYQQKKFFKQTDVMNILAKQNSEKKKKQDQHSVDQIVTEFSSLYFAGLQTTSNFLQMIIYLLSLHPQVKKKAIQQINEHLKNDSDYYNYEKLRSMKYIDAIQNQTLRFYGPISSGGFLRQATQDHKFGNATVLKGTLLLSIQITKHYDQNNFKNANLFRPERWIEGSSEQQHTHLLTGFGGGQRSCIGKQLALLQSKLCLAKFLKRYDYELEKKDFGMDASSLYSPERIYTKLVRIEKN